MKTLTILGTSSNSGKSWLTTALCACLRKRGVRVAPFKAQNMSNNAYATADGGEIGRAQAVQAEACGLLPEADMNPVLLKPSGEKGSQLVVLGQPREHLSATDYYTKIPELWEHVEAALGRWRERADLLLIEGAGSPVELNLMDRDIANLRPLRHTDGHWILVGDIERGGVFAQLIGTHHLLPTALQNRGLGLVVNKFRGDPSLFSEAPRHLAQHIPGIPYLGVLPYRGDLQPEPEDSLCTPIEQSLPSGISMIAAIRLPRAANTSDLDPFRHDEGVAVQWVDRPEALAQAHAIVIPGTKNTLADLRWLRETGLADAIIEKARHGTPVAGICGGYQILGETISDPSGTAGDAATRPGLGLLPIRTTYSPEKTIRQVRATWKSDTWQAYEIHMGLSSERRHEDCPLPPCLQKDGQPEGHRHGHIWGTYLHGLFESPALRADFLDQTGRSDIRVDPVPWRQRQLALYDQMADFIDEHLNLQSLFDHVAS